MTQNMTEEFRERLRTYEPGPNWKIEVGKVYLDRRGGIYKVIERLENGGDGFSRTHRVECVQTPEDNEHNEYIGDVWRHFSDGHHTLPKSREPLCETQLVLECDEKGNPVEGAKSQLQTNVNGKDILEMAIRLSAEKLGVDIPGEFADTVMSILNNEALDAVMEGA